MDEGIKLWVCDICGEPYIGSYIPNRCPFCGAYGKHLVEAKTMTPNFNIELTDKDRVNVETALGLEIHNTSIYFCAANNTDSDEGKKLFKALGKVEAEHASIWRKILKLPKEIIQESNECSTSNKENLQNSHDVESKAIEFYSKAAAESDHPRIRQIFEALIEVEKDHLQLSEERLNG